MCIYLLSAVSGAARCQKQWSICTYMGTLADMSEAALFFRRLTTDDGPRQAVVRRQWSVVHKISNYSIIIKTKQHGKQNQIHRGVRHAADLFF